MNENIFEVYSSEFPSVHNGAYRITWAKTNNLSKICSDLMHGRTPKSSTYRYGLFGTSPKTGFTVARKLKAISEQEQYWEQVATIEKV